MVYCGKPSMGCETCRKRRIKCDETKPVCNQCTKSRRHCSGYRSAFDILHRDETHTTKNRAKKAEAKKAAKRAADGSIPGLIQFDAGPDEVFDHAEGSDFASGSGFDVKREVLPPAVSPSTWASISPTTTTQTASSANTSPLEMTFPASSAAPSAALAIPLEQHASHYFASHFIMLPGQGLPQHSWRGHLDYLVPFLQSETDPNSSFQLAYKACGLAAMSNREKSVNTDLVWESYMQHSAAMRSISKDLANPARCKTDATLASVLLLCFFEKITANKETGLIAWRTHSEAAFHIVKSRGRDIFRKNQYSVRLFNAVRLDIIARTLSSGTSPNEGADWWLRENELGDPTGTRFQRFALEISDLRGEVTRLMTVLPHNDTGIDHMLEMLTKIHNLDRQIAQWVDNLPAEYQPITLCWEPDSGNQLAISETAVFPGRVDIYHDLVSASMLNGMRAARIILASILIRCAAWICSPADYRSTPEYTTAVNIIRTNISEILSSVPFMLSTFSANAQQASQRVVAGSFLCGADEQAKMVGGLMVSWPLSTVRTCDFSTDEQRSWAIGRLNYIANDLGIKYASTLAKAKVRFPSMLISRDGLMSAHDPLKVYKVTLGSQPIAVR